MRAQPDQVRRDALQLHHHHPDVLRALRDCQPQQFFHCQAVHQVIAQRIEVVYPVRQRDDLGIGLVFAGFFDARMEISEVGNRFHHRFAVQLQQDSQHAVRRRVLRPHVQDHGFRGAGYRVNGGHGVLLFLNISPVFGTSR